MNGLTVYIHVCVWCIYLITVFSISQHTTFSRSASKDVYGEWGPWSCDVSMESKCNGEVKNRCTEGCGCCDDDGFLIFPMDCPSSHDGHWEINGECDDCNGGSYKGPYDCECRDEHYGTCCNYDCLMPEYCKYQKCTTQEDVMCLVCRNHTDSSQAYFLNNEGRCLPKCNWLGHWCFPGTCDEDENYLQTTCQCTDGFTLHTPDKETTKCALSHDPDILTCHLGAESPLGEVANSTFKDNSTSCKSTEDAYVNFEIVHMHFEYSFSFELPEDPPTGEEQHQYVDTFAFGVIDASDTIIYYNNLGNETILESHDSNDHPNNMCNVGDFHHDNPVSGILITCKLNSNYGDLSDMKDGEKVCHKFEVTAGGFVDIEDMAQGTKARDYYNTRKTTKEVCFNIDYTDPDHCANSDESCTKDMLSFGNRIRRDLELNVTFDGWFDPQPQSNFSSPSGLSRYVIEIRDVIYTPTELVADFQNLLANTSEGEPISIELPYRGKPSIFAVYIWALDSTQESPNYKVARRFVLTDNVSDIEIDFSHPIIVTSASAETHFEWQIELSPIDISWASHFYNNFYIHTNLLLPIRADNLTSGPFEQETGELPVSGTPNNDGVVNYMYKYTLVSADYERESGYFNISQPLNEKISITDIVSDGDWINITIKAIDVMNNTLADNVVVKIDSSAPQVENIFLLMGNDESNGGLPTVELKFSSFDKHSGLSVVSWQLGTKFDSPDLDSGYLPIKKQPDDECGLLCYCPIIPESRCELFNYSITMPTPTKITEVGEYHVTLIVRNEAYLVTKIHFQLKDIGKIITAPLPTVDTSNNYGLIIGLSILSGLLLLAVTVLSSIIVIISIRHKKPHISKSNVKTSDEGNTDYTTLQMGTNNVKERDNYCDVDSGPNYTAPYENVAFEPNRVDDYQQLSDFEDTKGQYEMLPTTSFS